MEEKRIGVYVCWCGTNIALMVDVESLSKEMSKLPGVVISKNYKYMCSDPGQDLIINDIKEHQLNRIVVAACSPRMHEITFRRALEKAGLNPYLFEMANIREQVSWVHLDRNEIMRKAKSLVAAAVNRVRLHEPLDKRSVQINSATLIIGGGIAGLSAAIEIADAEKDVYIIEKTKKLGGQVAAIDQTYPFMDSAQQMLEAKLKRVYNHRHIKIFTESVIKAVTGYIGNFETTVYAANGNKTDLQFGNVIVATGLKPFDPGTIKNYGYGGLHDVITSLEFEKMLLNGKIHLKNGNDPRSVAIIHCVGSRNKNYHEYCSRTCCMTALKYANQIKSELPDTEVFEIYADMRSFGKGCEELYALSSRKHIKFLMYDQQKELPLIKKTVNDPEAAMLIEMDDLLSGKPIEVPADMVILMIGMEANHDAKDIAHAVGISMCGNGFFIEKHPKLDPVATTTDGVFIIGNCQGPKDIPDSISQARAAASRILESIACGFVEVEVITASVNEDLCCGCQTCLKVCPYGAVSFDKEKKVSVVNEILCKGCGTCGSSCPTGAIRSKHFTDSQILQQIEGLFSIEGIV